MNSAEVLAEFTLFKNTIRQDPQLMREGPHRVMEEAAGPMRVTLPNLAKLATIGLLLPTSTAGKYNRLSVCLYLKHIMSCLQCIWRRKKLLNDTN